MFLETKNLAKDFGGLRAICDFSFNIERGELVGIIGPNGSGKSTLFNLLTGFLRPTGGKILFYDQVLNDLPIHVIAQRGIARTFQSTRIFLEATLIHNVLIGILPGVKHGVWNALIGRRKREERELLERCRAVLRLVDLEDMSAKAAGELDQEQQKRLALGIAMATGPQVLLLDEPTGGINVEEINHLTEIIRRIWRQGVTICLIEHKMKMITELCERIIVLNYGEKIADGSPREVMHNEAAIKAYLGEDYAS